MAITQQYVCDGCGKHKGSANHWYVLLVARDLMQIRTWSTGVVMPGALHMCGEGCLQRAISARLGRASFAADAEGVDLAERLEEMDSRDVNFEVGAR